MSVTQVAVQTAYGESGTTLSTPSVSVSGSNAYGLAIVYSAANDLTTGVTWNGASMSNVLQLTGGNYGSISLYELVAPTTGVVTTTYSGSRVTVVHAILFNGVNQTTPRPYAAATQAFVSSSAVNTGSATGTDSTGLFVGAFSVAYTTLLTDDVSATLIADSTDAVPSVRGHSVTIPGAGSHTYAATLTASAGHTAFCLYLNSVTTQKLIAVGGQLIGINGQALHT